MERIQTENAPTPAGHYSQAVVHGGLVFVSGQLPIDPASGKCDAEASIEEQTRQTLSNVVAVVRAAGSDLEHVLKVTVYVPDVKLWGRLNQAYAEFFGEHRPARVVVPTRDLHYGALLEVEALAAVSP